MKEVFAAALQAMHVTAFDNDADFAVHVCPPSPVLAGKSLKNGFNRAASAQVDFEYVTVRSG